VIADRAHILLGAPPSQIRAENVKSSERAVMRPFDSDCQKSSAFEFSSLRYDMHDQPGAR
jgi:hypothetical protein